MGAPQKINPPKGATPIRATGKGGGAIIGYKIGNATYNTAGQATNKVAKDNSYGGKTLFGAKYIGSDAGSGLFGGVIDAVNTNISTPLTQALQPVEKVVTSVASDPKALVAIAIAVAAPYAAASIAPYLTAFGSYAGVAAQAITSITVQVAQGVPIEKATENALVNVAMSGASSEIQKQIGKVVSSDGVKNAITSTVTSGLATAAKGGSQADVEKAMTAGLVSSAASTAYKDAVDSTSTIASKAVGGAAGGAVTGGTEGAVIGGLTSTASALGSDLTADLKDKDKTVTDTTVKDGGSGGDTTVKDGGGGGGDTAISELTGKDLIQLAEDPATLIGPANPSTASLDTGVVSDAGSPAPVDATINIPPSTVAGLDITQDESAAETERLARLNQQATTPAPVTTDQQILDLIAENPAITDVAAVETPVEIDANIPRVEVSGVGNVEPTQGAYLPDTVPAETITIEPAPVAEGYSTSMPNESAAEAERLASREQEILDLIAENPTITSAETVGDEPTASDQTPVIVPPVSEVIPASVEIASTPVTELYDSTMEDQSQAETDRLTRQEQEILDLINPAPVVTEPTQGAYLPTTDIVAVDEAPITDTGIVDTSTVSDADQQILDLISEELAADTTADTTAEEEDEKAAVDGTEKGAYLPDSGTDTTTTTTTKPDIFTTTYLSPKKKTASSASALGSALGTTGLTASRGAGEIEGAGTGKPRKKVWNEESLKLKDALGV